MEPETGQEIYTEEELWKVTLQVLRKLTREVDSLKVRVAALEIAIAEVTRQD